MREIEKQVNENGWHAAGFVSYEAAPAFDRAMQVRDAGNFPLLWFGLYDAPKQVQLPIAKKDCTGLNWRPGVAQQTYNAGIQAIKNYIASGQTYQVNYTMRLQTEMPLEAWDFFLFLAQSQNKYAAYINTEWFAIASASPELFFKLNGDEIESHPMKGTVKRGRTTAEDKTQAEWLRSSVKNRAENVMIVDMIRNDLGRIAEVGSVSVPRLFQIEKYPTLLQMTSTVQAKTSASVTDIFSALFPCASITGAPKISTMRIIAELESTPRRIYTGSIGYIAPERKAQFNVAIRTAWMDKLHETAEYGVGGGIVWDSTSEDEYSEALLKARVLNEKPWEFSLLETLKWTKEEGYYLLEEHLERMRDSAEYFDFEFPSKKITAMLQTKAVDFRSAQRIRLLLAKNGDIQVEHSDLPPAKEFKAIVAESPLNTNDPFLFHKTTQRGMYPNPPAGFDDVLLYNEKGELTEFTIGNLVVEMNGKLYTPPVECGLLNGTFRQFLLQSGKISERVLLKNEIGGFAKIYLINSVRGWTPVSLNQ